MLRDGPAGLLGMRAGEVAETGLMLKSRRFVGVSTHAAEFSR
ncbi:hypothetical protein [Chenggangzhangella methanolivorans]|nr:hypothetical protein [Chenggangzhangella methanolivorans]